MKESVMTMMTDLLHGYSVDLATYLAVWRRKEQDEAICTGAKMLMDQPDILPKLEESLELQRSLLVPHHGDAPMQRLIISFRDSCTCSQILQNFCACLQKK